MTFGKCAALLLSTLHFSEMSSFYSVSIPEPVAALQQLAQILYGDEVLTVFWMNDTRQVVLERDGAWYIQPNGSVTRSLAALLQCAPHHLVASGLFFFETPGHGVAVDTRLSLAFYGCEWSDYACDKIALQFNLVVDPTLQSDAHRMTYVIGQMYADTVDENNDADAYDVEIPQSGWLTAQLYENEDIYDDMPALIPLENIRIQRGSGRRTVYTFGQLDENDGQYDEDDDIYADMPALIPLDNNSPYNVYNLRVQVENNNNQRQVFNEDAEPRYMTRSRARAARTN